METFVLPGFSLKNKEWAEEVKAKLPPNLNPQVIYWKHWQTENNNDFNQEDEAKKIVELVEQDQLTIIAKSIGTYITSLVIPQLFDQIEKLILCGIPLNDMKPEEQNRMMINLRVVNSTRLLCIQNSHDPHGTYDDVKKFLESVNPQITLMQKDRSDHEYPYFEEFQSFLT